MVAMTLEEKVELNIASMQKEPVLVSGHPLRSTYQVECYACKSIAEVNPSTAMCAGENVGYMLCSKCSEKSYLYISAEEEGKMLSKSWDEFLAKKSTQLVTSLQNREDIKNP